jgi:hypothetical protein
LTPRLCNPQKGNFRKEINTSANPANLSNIPVIIIRKYNLRYYHEKVKIKNKVEEKSDRQKNVASSRDYF